MTAITQFGDKTKTIFLKGAEAHKLHHEFVVATGQTIKKGNLVTLNTDGEVVLAADGAKSHLVIGHSVHNGAAGEFVTVAMKAYAIVFASPNGALNAGPVAYNGTNDEDTDYNSFQAPVVDADDIVGWALDKAEAADEIIRVALY